MQYTIYINLATMYEILWDTQHTFIYRRMGRVKQTVYVYYSYIIVM